MPYTFKIQSIPAGFGGALFDAARAQTTFAQQIERDRLRLAEEAAEREKVKLAIDADMAKLSMANQQAQETRLARQQQFDQRFQQQRLDFDVARTNTGFSLDAQRLALSEAQGNASLQQSQQRLGLDISRENRIAINDAQQLQQVARSEQLQLLKMGARPIARDATPNGAAVYTDGKGRSWALPADQGGDALKQLVPFLRHNIDVTEQEMSRRLKDRDELQEKIDKLKAGIAQDESFAADATKPKGRRAAAQKRVDAVAERIAELEKQREDLGDPASLTRRRDAYRDVWARLIGADPLGPSQFQVPGTPAPPTQGQTAGEGQQAPAPAIDPDSPFAALAQKIYDAAAPDLSQLPQGIPAPNFSAFPDTVRRQAVADWNGLAAKIVQAKGAVEAAARQAQQAKQAFATAQGSVARQQAELLREQAIREEVEATKSFATIHEHWKFFAAQMAATAKLLGDR